MTIKRSIAKPKKQSYMNMLPYHRSKYAYTTLQEQHRIIKLPPQRPTPVTRLIIELIATTGNAYVVTWGETGRPVLSCLSVYEGFSRMKPLGSSDDIARTSEFFKDFFKKLLDIVKLCRDNILSNNIIGFSSSFSI